jgi:hypothetical protein
VDGFALHEAMYVRVADEKEALIREAINFHMLAGCSKDVGHVSAETTSQGGFGSQTSISSNLRTTPIAYCLPLTCLLECVAEAIRFLLYRAIYLVHGNRYARQTRDE